MYTEGVELIPVTAFRLEPLLQPGQHPGHLTVDGEQVRTETIQVRGREGRREGGREGMRG